MRVKLGDTLIEVAIAIGIFSLVAVSVVAVVSGSTSSAQSALELTITREEIDAQAEALRFIQSSYIAGGMANIGGAKQTKYAEIWKQITSRAIDFNNLSDQELADAVLNYNPRTCTELYDFGLNPKENSIVRQRAFVINTRNVGLSVENIGTNASNVVLVAGSATQGIFTPAATYPRILYDGQAENALYDDTMVRSANEVSYINRAEGIFVVAVKDTGSVVVQNGTPQAGVAAYYDFYIRSCWFTPGAERPSTIQTVIRLQDPAVIDYNV